MKPRALIRVLSLLGLLAVTAALAAEAAPSRPSALYEEWRRSPAPADGSVATSNPPSLLWASVKQQEGRDVRYVVSLSDDPTFPEARTQRFAPQRACFFNPHAKLKSGRWYWRYEIQSDRASVTKGPYSFQITDAVFVFESPKFEEFAARVSLKHPKVITQGRDLADVRSTAQAHPQTAEIVRQGRAALKSPIYRGAVADPSDPARTRALSRKAGQEVRLLHQLIDAHVLVPSPEMLEASRARIEVLLGWPTDDLLGSQVLTALAKAYDALHADLSPEVRTRMLTVIERQFKHGLAAWPGRIEARHVENHFWQMELAGNFIAALATVHDLPAAREMLEYTYELFLARFPNLATRDGGWAEGFSYFGVNESCIVDMALLMKRVGGFDVFKMEWYRSLADYYTYFAPIGGRMDGFGDSHDRVGNGNIGQGMMFVVGQENQDRLALYRAARLETQSGVAVEPWYRVVENIRFDPDTVTTPKDLAQARMFSGVGLAASHTDVLDSANDTAVYFRSSPFGAKGHMHANQNAFNLSRRGEPVFYSTGYYTTFADAHSLSSYRHTRAHNAILVNGCGQAFGHEGYGWIKRYAHGREISYVCGDATKAYQMPVDRQFLGLLADAGIPASRETGFGDAKLTLFERHLAHVRPDIVVIYDVLEAEQNSEWTLLLHSMFPPTLKRDGQVDLEAAKSRARVVVQGSSPLVSSVTDKFHVTPVDTLKKYGAMPDQHHLSYVSGHKSQRMRFLTVIQLGDLGGELPVLALAEDGRWSIGGVRLAAELDPAKPAALTIETENASLHVNSWPATVRGSSTPAADGAATLLSEKGENGPILTVAPNRAPTF